MKRIFFLNSIIQFVLLFGLWLMLSGHYDVTHISMGVISCLLIIFLNIRLRKYYYFEDELEEAQAKLKGIAPGRIRIARLFFYIPWLIWQIVIASLQVAAVVLRPKMPIDPALMHFKTKLPNMESKVILANSITLTPGTITIRLKGNDFLVHSLMDVSQTGIIDESLPIQVAKLYERKPEHVVQNMKIIKSSAEL